jgi:hypothetical protein
MITNAHDIFTQNYFFILYLTQKRQKYVSGIEHTQRQTMPSTTGTYEKPCAFMEDQT